MRSGWRRLFRNPFAEAAERRAVEDEIAFHLDEIERRLIAEGISPDRARAEARRRFGSPARWRADALEESARRERSLRRRGFLEAVGGELQASLRQLRRRPPSTAAALVIMSLGVASGAAVWAVMDPVLFRPLPFPASERVVAITGSNTRSINWWLSEFTYERFREAQRSFSTMAATRDLTVTVLEPFPDDIGALRVESTFFEVIGVQPALGRAFEREDDAHDAEQVAVLSHDLWQGRYGGDPGILGTDLRLRGATATVVGVMPERFRWEADQFDEPRPEGPERRLFLNRIFGEGPPEVASSGRLMPVARLADGVSKAAADEDLDRIAHGLVEAYPEHFDDDVSGWGPFTAQVWSIRERLLWLVEDEVWLLAPAVGFLLLLVSLNAGSLLLVGLLDRRAELAVRASLGASGPRLAGQVLLETGLVWMVALAVGIGLAAVALPTIRGLAPAQLPFTDLISLHPRTVLGAGAITVVLWLGSALPPLLSGVRMDVLSALKLGGWSGTRRQPGSQRTLIVLQMALACGLTGGAALLVHGYASLLDVSPGAEAENVLTIEIRPSIDRFAEPTVTVGDLGGPWDPSNEWLTAEEQLYGTGARLETFVQETLDRLRSVPGVRGASFTNMPPFYRSSAWRGVLRPDQTWLIPREEMEWARAKWVSPSYFETVGLPILRGRPLLATDDARGTRVIVVNEAFVERFMPDAPDPLGRTVPLELSAYLPSEEWTVVGIAPNELHYGPHEPEEPAFYVPLAQLPRHWTSDQVGWTRLIWFLIEYEGDAVSVLPGVREAVWSMAPDIPLRTETTLPEMRRSLTIQTRFFTTLLGCFALLALILATAGLMSMMAQQVRHRTREYGLRKALGAGVPDVVARTLRHGASLALVGIVVGTALAWLLARLLAGLVTGVEGWSPAPQIAVAGLLLAAALAASLGPALRAARVDPVVSLKAD